MTGPEFPRRRLSKDSVESIEPQIMLKFSASNIGKYVKIVSAKSRFHGAYARILSIRADRPNQYKLLIIHDGIKTESSLNYSSCIFLDEDEIKKAKHHESVTKARILKRSSDSLDRSDQPLKRKESYKQNSLAESDDDDDDDDLSSSGTSEQNPLNISADSNATIPGHIEAIKLLTWVCIRKESSKFYSFIAQITKTYGNRVYFIVAIPCRSAVTPFQYLRSDISWSSLTPISIDEAKTVLAANFPISGKLSPTVSINQNILPWTPQSSSSPASASSPSSSSSASLKDFQWVRVLSRDSKYRDCIGQVQKELSQRIGMSGRDPYENIVVMDRFQSGCPLAIISVKISNLLPLTVDEAKRLLGKYVVHAGTRTQRPDRLIVPLSMCV
jgi:hypothetical protein